MMLRKNVTISTGTNTFSLLQETANVVSSSGSGSTRSLMDKRCFKFSENSQKDCNARNGHVRAKEDDHEDYKISRNTKWMPVSYHQLPDWLRDNQYLLHGHRPQLTFLESLKSLFRIHSETINIWTHFAGFFVYLSMWLSFMFREAQSVSESDLKWLSLPMISYLCTLAFSACFHLFSCHSPTTHKRCLKLDYFGIHLVSVNLCMSWMHYTFYCHEDIKMKYIITTWLLAPVCIASGLFDRFAKPDFRVIRAVMLGVLGAFGHIGGIHYALSHVSYAQVQEEGLMYLFYAALTMYIGGAIFAMQLPECYSPGTFDICGGSHQILHMCVLIAGYLHFMGLKHIAQYRYTNGCVNL